MFRFSIRDVLWLTVVVAVTLGWIISISQVQRSLAKQQLEAVLSRSQLESQSVRVRELIWLTLLVAVGLGWFLTARKPA